MYEATCCRLRLRVRLIRPEAFCHFWGELNGEVITLDHYSCNDLKISPVNFRLLRDTGRKSRGAAVNRKGGVMHTAMRIDFGRPQVGRSDARFFAVALASGIAGLTVTYPTITLGNGTVGEWAGRFEVRPPRLAAAEILPEMSITAGFRDTAVIAARGARAAAAGLAETFTSARQPLFSAQPGARAVAVANQASSPMSAGSMHEESPAHRALAPHSLAATEKVVSVAPLDAVRIVLPPAAASKSGSPGAMPSQATLDFAASGTPSTFTETQPLARGSQPQARSVSTPEPTPQPFGLFSGAKEVREFDLAKIGGAKSISDDLARPAGSAIAPAQAAGRVGNLSKVSKIPDRIVGDYILHVAGLSLEGMPSGNLSVRIGMGGDLSVKLADLLLPVRDQMAPEAFQRLANSSAASEYVSFAQLRAAGFDIRYDAGSDRLMVSAQP